MPFEWYAKAPGQHVEVSLGDFDASRGFDGTVAWSLNVTETGFRELHGADLAAVRRDAEFYREIKLRELYPTMSVAGIAKVGGRDAYIVDARPTEGSSETLYFDVRSGLLVRRDQVIEIPRDGVIPVEAMIEQRVETSYEDYREVDGIRLPFTIRQRLVGLSTEVTYSLNEVTHNAVIDPATFAIPIRP